MVRACQSHLAKLYRLIDRKIAKDYEADTSRLSEEVERCAELEDRLSEALEDG